MKTKAIVMCSLLALGVWMTSCKDDDKSVALASINVTSDKDVSTLFAGDEAQLTATAMPDGAVLGSVTWATSNPAVATVTAGKVTAVGEGTAVITATSGTAQGKITVTVDLVFGGIAVLVDGKDNVIQTEGTLQLEVSAVRAKDAAKLTAAAGTITWSSDKSVVSVGEKTGLAKVGGLGTAVITAKVTVEGKEYSATFTFMTTNNVLQSAVGLWTFDDAENLGKAEKGADLLVHGTLFSMPGTVDGDLAVRGKRNDPALEWVHGMAANNEAAACIDKFTMMWDIRIDQSGRYACLYWNGNVNDDTRAINCRWRASGNSFNSDFQNQNDFLLLQDKVAENGPTDAWGLEELDNYADDGTIDPGMPTRNWCRWIRVVLVVDGTPSAEFPLGKGNLYVDGVQRGNSGGVKDVALTEARLPVTRIFPGQSVWFLTSPPTKNTPPEPSAITEDPPFPFSTIAVWNKALTAAEVEALGAAK